MNAACRREFYFIIVREWWQTHDEQIQIGAFNHHAIIGERLCVSCRVLFGERACFGLRVIAERNEFDFIFQIERGLCVFLRNAAATENAGT